MVFLKKFLRKNKKVVIIGLDNAGKTSLLPYLKNGNYLKLMPDIAKEQSVLKFHDQKVEIVVLNKKNILRESWDNEASKADLIMFMVDAQTPERYDEARKELWKLSSMFSDKSFIILANKLDQQPISKLEEIREALNLSQIPESILLPISCKTGFGLIDVYSKLYCKLVLNKYKKRNKIEALKVFNKNGLPLITKNGYYSYDDVQKGKILTGIIAIIKKLYKSDLKTIGTENHKFYIHYSKHFLASFILKTEERQNYHKMEAFLTDLLKNLEKMNSHLENVNLYPSKIDFNVQEELFDQIPNLETLLSWRIDKRKNNTGAL